MRCSLDVDAEMPNPQLEASDEKSGTGRHVLSCLCIGGVERHAQVEVIMAGVQRAGPRGWDVLQPTFRRGWGDYRAEKAEKER